ncbi:hypothetical protein [Psychrobacter faecalis]|uniref:hypothetical protein n=1 Tax=Psychrobacter faecalis TaxID=180588 RepID=UPI003FD1A838
MTPVQTSQNNENATDTSTDNRGGNEEQAYYSGADSAEDKGKGVDAVTVNEKNPNLYQTPAEGAQ